jgi:hypothetical protein
MEGEVHAFCKSIRCGIIPMVVLTETLAPNGSVASGWTNSTDESAMLGGKKKGAKSDSGNANWKMEIDVIE